MNEEMKAKLAKYMQDNGYYDTMAIRRDEGYSNRAASFFAIFGDDGEGREEERSELLAAADAYNEAKMAAEKAAQPAKPQTKTEIVHAPFADLGQDSIIEVPVSENNEQPESEPQAQTITKVSTKRVEKYITQSLCVNYRGDYLAVASVDMMDFDTPYSISYHAGRFPAFEVEYFATIEELAVAMREIADLRTWKLNKYED